MVCGAYDACCGAKPLRSPAMQSSLTMSSAHSGVAHVHQQFMTSTPQGFSTNISLNPSSLSSLSSSSRLPFVDASLRLLTCPLMVHEYHRSSGAMNQSMGGISEGQLFLYFLYIFSSCSFNPTKMGIGALSKCGDYMYNMPYYIVELYIYMLILFKINLRKIYVLIHVILF